MYSFFIHRSAKLIDQSNRLNCQTQTEPFHQSNNQSTRDWRALGKSKGDDSLAMTRPQVNHGAKAETERQMWDAVHGQNRGSHPQTSPMTIVGCHY